MESSFMANLIKKRRDESIGSMMDFYRVVLSL